MKEIWWQKKRNQVEGGGDPIRSPLAAPSDQSPNRSFDPIPPSCCWRVTAQWSMGLEVNRGQSSLSIPNPNSQFPTPKSQPPIHRVVSPPTNNTASGAGGELPTLHLSRSLPGESPPPPPSPPLPSLSPRTPRSSPLRRHRFTPAALDTFRIWPARVNRSEAPWIMLLFERIWLMSWYE